MIPTAYLRFVQRKPDLTINGVVYEHKILQQWWYDPTKQFNKETWIHGDERTEPKHGFGKWVDVGVE